MFDAYIAYQARFRPQAPAVVALDGTVSFEKLDADVDRAAVELRDIRPGPGEAVAVDLTDIYLHWVVVLALARLGIASAPGTDAACRFRVSDRAGGISTATVTIGSAEADRILRGPRPRVVPLRPDPAQVGRVLKSSGTTGEEKRVGMSWRVIDAAIRNSPIAYGVPQGPWLASTGINTILGLVMTLTCWAAGNPVILGLGGTMEAGPLMRLRPAMIALVPQQLRELLDGLPGDFQRWPFRILSGGGAVPPALAQRTRRLLTSDLRSVYGTSESGGVAVADLPLLERHDAAAGYVLPGVALEIVGEGGAQLPAGELGRVRVRSDRMVDHYLDDPERSATAFQDGWFYPGDMGRLTEDGLLLIEGRQDDLMNLAGHKVLPAWVEQAALGCAGVGEVAAFSSKDEDGLEQCWLAIVPTEGFAPRALAEALPRQLGWLHRIRWMTVTSLPRNQMGKVDRNRLRALARDVDAD